MKDRFLKHKILLLLIVEVSVGVLSSLALAVIFFKIFHEVLDQDTLNLDRQISAFIYTWRNDLMTKIMMFITRLGAGYMIFFSILGVILLVWRKHRKEALGLVIILIMGLLVNVLLKGVIHRPRPEMSPLVAVTSSSFPSGHAMNATVFYLTISFYCYHFSRRKKLSVIVSIVSIMLIILIGFSRVYLGVHYPSDVVAGAVVGTWWLITSILIIKSINLFKIFKAEKKKELY